MVVGEVVAGVLLFALAVATTVGLYIGLLGVLGAIRLDRCDRCGHLGVVSRAEHATTCPYCRHERLLHPIYTLHHAHEEGQLEHL